MELMFFQEMGPHRGFCGGSDTAHGALIPVGIAGVLLLSNSSFLLTAGSFFSSGISSFSVSTNFRPCSVDIAQEEVSDTALFQP